MNEIYLQRLKEDLRLKNYAKNTREDYYRFVVRFLDFTRKDAMAVTYADIRKFVFHMMDNESKKASTINTYTAAIRFFFEYTLGYVWDPKKLPKMKRDRYLPVVLTREQVGMLIDSMDNYKILTEYWYRYGRPMGWLFPSTVRDEPLTTSSVEQFVKAHARALGLPEGVTPHTLRHSFACHALEDGVSHTFIQQLLGHRSPGSTDVYLQMTSKALMGIRSPYDTFGPSEEEGVCNG